MLLKNERSEDDIPSLEVNESRNGKLVTWTDLTVTVPMNPNNSSNFWRKSEAEQRKTILYEVSGFASPGELLAIMGGSGSGKTVLLNALTGHNQKNVNVTGVVTVNGEELQSVDMRRVSAYVQQADMFIGTLTVKEQLHFSVPPIRGSQNDLLKAELRMDRSVSKEVRKQRVQQVIKDLGLGKCENTLIGVPNRLKGISCGECKRLAFACEILTDPSILFCDEPTSGLDSFMAAQVVSCLKDMAKQKKTVVVTIHQPSTQVFLMFDNLCLMAMGQIAYFGPVEKVCDFWKEIGLECPPTFNPADHVIRTLSIADNDQLASYDRIRMIRTKYEESEYGMKMYRKTHGKGSKHIIGNADLKRSNKYPAGFFKQTSALFRRSFLTTLRDPLLLKVKFIQVVATSFIIGIVNFRTVITGPTVMNIEGILYNTVRDMNFMFLFPSINVITSELPIFLREHRAGIYRAETYYIAKSFAEMPQYTILPIIYSIVVYFMSGLNESIDSFFTYTALTVVLTYVAISIAYAGACVFGEDSLALTYMPCFILPMLVFGGFYINFHSIPFYFNWISFLSWFRYGFEALQINQWTSIAVIEGCENGTVANSADDYCPARDGIGLLNRRGMGTTKEVMVVNSAILVIMFIFFRCIGLVAIIVRVRLMN
ncbi:ABC transporter ATP-binding protein/permease wht-1 [Toxocara canis]|uniref:ABC transporter ATP-binding protein/permease wht-1 n=1 Tax=Toxocara canis TaxID=6265 RepID=A0A0B2UKL5_TOXCA|nr:ABC transporter ATP-binding protein/permease wht-1 [Toxocara canis]